MLKGFLVLCGRVLRRASPQIACVESVSPVADSTRDEPGAQDVTVAEATSSSNSDESFLTRSSFCGDRPVTAAHITGTLPESCHGEVKSLLASGTICVFGAGQCPVNALIKINRAETNYVREAPRLPLYRTAATLNPSISRTGSLPSRLEASYLALTARFSPGSSEK